MPVKIARPYPALNEYLFADIILEIGRMIIFLYRILKQTLHYLCLTDSPEIPVVPGEDIRRLMRQPALSATPLPGLSSDVYESTRATYNLHRLHLRGLIERIPALTVIKSLKPAGALPCAANPRPPAYHQSHVP